MELAADLTVGDDDHDDVGEAMPPPVLAEPALAVLEPAWKDLSSYMSDSGGALSTPFVREGKRLLAAVQDLKAETRRMCDQQREQDGE